MNPNLSQQSAASADTSDRMSPCASAGASQSGWTDEFGKDEELDGSDDISDDSGGHDGVSSKHAPLREQDRFLPIANIAKIMKRAIPDNGKIAKDSRECIQECVSEFISFITSEASDRCHQEKRKTINGDDILYAMMALGFDNYAEPLTLYLQKYRETTKTERIVLTAVGVVQGGGEGAGVAAAGAGGTVAGAVATDGTEAGGSARTSLTTTAASECPDDQASSMLFFKTESGTDLSF